MGSGRSVISWQLRWLIRFAPRNRIYFEILGNGFAFVPSEKGERIVFGRCEFANESRFWQLSVEGLANRDFVRVEAESVEPYKDALCAYLGSIHQVGSVSVATRTDAGVPSENAKPPNTWDA